MPQDVKKARAALNALADELKAEGDRGAAGTIHQIIRDYLRMKPGKRHPTNATLVTTQNYSMIKKMTGYMSIRDIANETGVSHSRIADIRRGVIFMENGSLMGRYPDGTIYRKKAAK